MKKELFCLAICTLLVACGEDDLTNVQNRTISKNSKITYKEAADKYQFCTQESKKWVLEPGMRETDIVAIFSCDFKPSAFADFNEQEKKRAENSNKKPNLVTKATLQLRMTASKDSEYKNYLQTLQTNKVVYENGKEGRVGGFPSRHLKNNENPFVKKPRSKK